MKDAYLILYNNALTVGWAMVWCIAANAVVTGMLMNRNQLQLQQLVTVRLHEVLAQVYAADGLALMLVFSQTAALLEIFHAMTGLVRSPVAVTFMQVMSRIVALVAIVYSESAQCKYCTRKRTSTRSTPYPVRIRILFG